MNYLITAAGLGKRFLKERIKPPKPLVKVKGLELIFWSLRSFKFEPFDNLYIVCLKTDLLKQKINKKLLLLYPHLNVFWLELDSIKNGQLLSALEAINYFGIKNELIIHNCDTSFRLNNCEFNNLKKEDIFGIIPYFISDGDNWSFINVDNGLIREVKEKKRISDKCSVGTYYFLDAEILVKLADAYILQNKNYLNEFYIAPIYDYAINNAFKVLPIQCESVMTFGTPKELLQSFGISFYELLSENDFNGHQRKTLVVDIDGTLCNSPEKGDYSNCEVISEAFNKLIAEDQKGTYIILFTSRNMRSFGGNIGLINKYTSSTLSKWLKDKNIPYDELYFGKPWGNGDLSYIDDKLITIDSFVNYPH